jgi:hypothetical protein
MSGLPTDAAARKDMPMARGLLDYFPLALAAVADVSRVGNEQHNPGQPMHWAKGKSVDHADCIVRHLVDRGTLDVDKLRHSAKLAWRALALLQTELEALAEPREVDCEQAVIDGRAGMRVSWSDPDADGHYYEIDGKRVLKADYLAATRVRNPAKLVRGFDVCGDDDAPVLKAGGILRPYTPTGRP